jgi:hypothetical protein
MIARLRPRAGILMKWRSPDLHGFGFTLCVLAAVAVSMTWPLIQVAGLAPAIFGPMQNATGSVLASFWRRRPPR